MGITDQRSTMSLVDVVAGEKRMATFKLRLRSTMLKVLSFVTRMMNLLHTASARVHTFAWQQRLRSTRRESNGRWKFMHR